MRFMPKKIRKPTKTDLIQAVLTLLQQNTIGTQEEICEALAKQGIHVNQVTVSRILHKLNAIKMTEGDKTVYRLSSELIAVRPNDSLKHLITNISHNESLIVIHTAPGAGPAVAALLDQEKAVGLLGTVAGDNTIIAVPKKVKQLQLTFNNINKLLLGE